MLPMVPKFFGQYLLEKDVLSKDQLVKAINYQKSKILKLGEIAVDRGYITEKQAAKINNEQKRTDMRFGDLAVNMGMLTEEQLEEIITIQKNNHVYLGEAIVACGFLNQDSVDRELGHFKKEQTAIPMVEVMIEEDIPNKSSVETMVDLTGKLLLRVGDLQSKTGRLTITEEPVKNLGAMSVIDFKGSVSCRYILNVSWDVGHQIAKRTFKKDDLPFDKELILDTVAEFVNVVCGNVRSKIIEDGKTLDIDPPYNYLDDKDTTVPPRANEAIVIVPFYTPIGNLEVAVGYAK